MSCEFIRSIFKIIGSASRHFHSCLDTTIVFSSRNYIGNTKCILMNGDKFIRSSQKTFFKNFCKVFNCCFSVIDKCLDLYMSLYCHLCCRVTELIRRDHLYCFSCIADAFTCKESVVFTKSFSVSIKMYLEFFSSISVELFSEYSSEFCYLIFSNDKEFWINSSRKIFFCLCVDFISIEFKSWDRHICSSCYISSNSDNSPCFIIPIRYDTCFY